MTAALFILSIILLIMSIIEPILLYGKRYNKFVIKLIGSYYLVVPLIALVMLILISLIIITHTY